LDHVFVGAKRGAPEAEQLVHYGLREGTSNVHPGQGTRNKRFFFRNAMLELLWVENPVEAQSEQTAPTRLWERWSKRRSGASPFGIIVRSANGMPTPVPFPAIWYRPIWLPPDLQVYIALTGVEEPMWIFMPFLRRIQHEQRFVEHPNGAREITRLTLTAPVPLQSAAALALRKTVISDLEGPEHLLTIELDHGLRNEVADFRPRLPLVFQR
jgi:hypothetical protein